MLRCSDERTNHYDNTSTIVSALLRSTMPFSHAYSTATSGLTRSGGIYRQSDGIPATFILIARV